MQRVISQIILIDSGPTALRTPPLLLLHHLLTRLIMAHSEAQTASILLLGGGAVGSIAALNIESGKLGAVTAVLRSNFQAVRDHGYRIESVDHGKLTGWRPTKGTWWRQW